MKDLMNVKPKKNPLPLKNFYLHACPWFLSNMFTSLVISFVYLTNRLTNICTIKTTLHKALF